MRAPMESTLASLCWRLIRAVYRSLHSAARTPRTLLAAICSPWPEPPSDDATVDRPSAVDHRPADGGADRRVVDRLGGVGAEVDDLVAELGEGPQQVLLERVPGVVGPDGDAHAAGL